MWHWTIYYQIPLLAKAHEKVVRFDIAMDEILAVDELNSGDELKRDISHKIVRTVALANIILVSVPGLPEAGLS